MGTDQGRFFLPCVGKIEGFWQDFLATTEI
jgi:hypothetical protein